MVKMFKVKAHSRGFTLAELLIALAILGVIATFTIPKIIISQQNGQYNAIAKETMGMVSGAYQQASAAGVLNSTTKPSDLKAYMNYVANDTTSVVDDITGFGSHVCNNASYPCIKLHNGAILKFDDGNQFGGTSTTNVIFFRLDPDGGYSGTTNGPGKTFSFALYYNGFITSSDNLKAGSAGSYGAYGSCAACTPSWFSW